MNSNTSPPRRSKSPSDVALMSSVRSRTPSSNSNGMQTTRTVPQAPTNAPATASRSQRPLGGRSTIRYVRPDRPGRHDNPSDTVNCRECFQLRSRGQMVDNNLNSICLACQATQVARQANAPRPAQYPTEHAQAAAWTRNLDEESAVFSREYNAFLARVAAPTYEDQRYWHQRRSALDQRKHQLDNFKRSIGYRSPSPQRGPAGPAPGSTRPSSSSG